MTTAISRKKRIRDPICSFLKKLISPYGFGWEENGKVERYTNEHLIRWYNTKGFMGSPTNSAIYMHFAGQITLYFWADGRKNTSQTLSMIDIDCHKQGNAESAKAFADWLCQNGFPNLYHEPSTHGKGRHGYIVLFKEGFKDIAVRNALNQLEKTAELLVHPDHRPRSTTTTGSLPQPRTTRSPSPSDRVSG